MNGRHSGLACYCFASTGRFVFSVWSLVRPLIFPCQSRSSAKVFLSPALPISVPACIIAKDRHDSYNGVKSAPSEGIYFLLTLSDAMQLSSLTLLFAFKFSLLFSRLAPDFIVLGSSCFLRNLKFVYVFLILCFKIDFSGFFFFLVVVFHILFIAFFVFSRRISRKMLN